MPPASTVPVAGFTDQHTHLLKAAAGIPFAWAGMTVRDFHHQVAGAGSTPMDIADPSPDAPAGVLAQRLLAGLAQAAAVGLTEITEMGMRDWWYLDALNTLQRQRGTLPARVRVYLASGLAGSATVAELAARRADCGPWVRLEGIKFYADGWLVPRTCAMCRDFADEDTDGLLFAGSAMLARRIEPFAADGWRIATHAIGDRAVATVLDAYEMVWGADRVALGAAQPRIEHGSVLSADLIARIASLGVAVCIQPSFAVSDARHVAAALGQDRAATAYPWTALAASGARLLLGSDYPIEVIDPLPGLARLVSGRSDRPGFGTGQSAPPHSRLPLDLALTLSGDLTSGTTALSADPRTAAGLDQIDVLGTAPLPF